MSFSFKAITPALLLSLSGLSTQLVAQPFGQAAASSQAQAPAPRLGWVVQFAPTAEESPLLRDGAVHLVGSGFGTGPGVPQVYLNGVLLGPDQYRKINDFLIVMPRKHWDSVTTTWGSNLVQVLHPGGGHSLPAQLIVQGQPWLYSGPGAMLTGHGAASSRTVTDDREDMVREAFHIMRSNFQFERVAPAAAEAATVPACADPAPDELYASPLLGPAPSGPGTDQAEQAGLETFRLGQNPLMSLPQSPAQSGQATPSMNPEQVGPPLVVTNTTPRVYRLTLTRADQPLFLVLPTAEQEVRSTEVRLGVPMDVPAMATLHLAPGAQASRCTAFFTLEAAPQEDAQGRDHFRWQFQGRAGSLVRVNTNERPHSSSLFHEFRIDSGSAVTIRAVGPEMTEASFEDLLKQALTRHEGHGGATAPSQAPSVAEPSRPMAPATPAASLASPSVGEGDHEALDEAWAEGMEDDDEEALPPPQRMMVEEDLVSLLEAIDEDLSEAQTQDEDEEDMEEASSSSVEDASEDADSEYEPTQRTHVTPLKRKRLNSPAAQAMAPSKPKPLQNSGKKASARRTARLPLAPKKVLEAWFFAHWDHPYPTESEMEALQSTTGLKLKQIRDWCTNTRKRAWTRSSQAGIDKVFGAYFANAKVTKPLSQKRKTPATPTAPAPRPAAAAASPAPAPRPAAAAASPALARPKAVTPGIRASSRPKASPSAPSPRSIGHYGPDHPMVAWMLEHADDPYPSSEQKLHFATTLNMTYGQVQCWLINYRMRHGQSRTPQPTAAPQAPAAEPEQPLKRSKH